MTQREKRLGLIAGVVFGAMFAWMGVNSLLIEPVDELDASIASLENKLAKIESENAARGQLQQKIREFSARCFGPAADASAVQGDVEQHLVDLLDRSGLTYDKLRRVPRSGKKDAYAVVARSITALGSLDQVTNLLYLLDQQPQPHATGSLSIEPQKNTNIVELSLQYQTPLPRPLPYDDAKSLRKLKPHDYAALSISDIRFASPATVGELNSPARSELDVIAARDPLRRYQPAPRVTRRPRRPKPEPRRDPQPQPQPRPQPRSDSARYQLTGLSSFDGQPRIMIRDNASGATSVHKIGDTFDGGRIVMVDYRPLPDPANPELTVQSRIILKKGPDYWAVDRGQTFDKKRLLKKKQLPPSLRGRSESRASARP